MRTAVTVGALILASAAAVDAELATTKLYDFVNTPASVIYGPTGDTPIPFDPPGGLYIDVSGYRKVSFQISGAKATHFSLNMGIIAQTTVSQAFTGVIDNKIHTYSVVGPQMSLHLTGGPGNAHDKVQVWVFLTS